MLGSKYSLLKLLDLADVVHWKDGLLLFMCSIVPSSAATVQAGFTLNLLEVQTLFSADITNGYVPGFVDMWTQSMHAGVKNYPFILCDCGAVLGDTSSFYSVKC